MSRFPTDLFAGSRFAVLGLGRNGAPAACALASMGAEVVAWDDDAATRAAFVGAAEVRDLAQGPFDFDALVLSPGIPHILPAPHPVALKARATGIPILSDAELLFQAVRRAGSRARFVGITGTNGKSTTTALLAHLLTTAGHQVAAGGNLGPASLALPLLGDDGIYVLEMSSYMLERLATLRFDVAAMLNISADHLDRHAGMPGYLAAKRAVFDRQTGDDVAVVGVDDAESRTCAIWLRTHPARVVTVSGQGIADVWCDRGILRDADGPIVDMAQVAALPGTHNAQDAAAAAAIGSALGSGPSCPRKRAFKRASKRAYTSPSDPSGGMDSRLRGNDEVARQQLARQQLARQQLTAAIRGFPGLPHRQQRVGCQDGIVFINDSKATNADAAARALACYDRLVWIAGGLAKAGGIVPLAPYFPRIAHAVLIGRDAPVLAATLAAAGVSHTIAGTLEKAVPEAFTAARRTGSPVVLLSPACASFDQFSGFDARGERFAALARTLAQSLAHEATA
ncbi:MAG: UDP-N-acetylmuramoyl-L-alanine--D-glutamate ligase [Acetobacteraceae bacterium]